MEDFMSKTGVQIAGFKATQKEFIFEKILNTMVNLSNQQNVYKNFCEDLIKTNNTVCGKK